MSPRGTDDVSHAGQRRSWHEPGRFLLVGTINTLVAYALYILLLQVLPYALAYSASYFTGIYVSYCLNALFVFKQRLRLSTALQYPAIYVVQYCFGLLLMWALVELVGINSYIAPFIVAVLNIPLAFILSRYIIKRNTGDAAVAAGPGQHRTDDVSGRETANPKF